MEALKNAIACFDNCWKNFAIYFLDTFRCHSECRGCCTCDVSSTHVDHAEVPGGDGEDSEGHEKINKHAEHD
jgi:hypothetical protein